MGKRPQDKGSTSRKLFIPTRPATEQTPKIPANARSTPTRPATEQTPEIPTDAEATMQDSGNASILRCSGTAQQPSAIKQRQSEVVQNFTASFLYGCGVFKTSTGNQGQQLLIMTTLATAMRAANVADFYMTKYLSKAQEALGPVIQPFIAGMRRIADAERAPEAAESTLVQRARQRIRRFIFCANRTMWFSACELGVFLATSSSCAKHNITSRSSLAKASQ